jgi:hypothetical protein
MKKIIAALSLVFAAACACFAQQTPVNPAIEPVQKAEEKVDPNLWDFKDVPAGEKVTHNFLIKNNSSITLNIKNVNTSCGCTASEIKNKSLKPGEETQLEVRFNSAKYNGPVTQFVYVNTDDVDNPVVKYTIRANVVVKKEVKK